MKALVLLFFAAAVHAIWEPVKKTCTEGPQTAHCFAYIPSYYYDPETGTCKEFIYRGCGGNGNRYENQDDCLQNCAGIQAAADKPDCDKAPDSGLCEAYMPRYYYDQEDGKCKSFIYGGCGGNQNNFMTERECQAKCGGTVKKTCTEKPETGLCKAYIPSYYYDPGTVTCKKFIYGGCGGNGNRYPTEEKCLQNCLGIQAAVERPDCDKAPEAGVCDAYFPRFYYDQEDGTCKTFVYGGCGGNRNNFISKEECLKKCGALSAPSSCHLKSDGGPCEGHYKRFYYNDQTKTCEEFVYGGCLGNENNFETAGQCLDICSD